MPQGGAKQSPCPGGRAQHAECKQVDTGAGASTVQKRRKLDAVAGKILENMQTHTHTATCKGRPPDAPPALLIL